MNPKQKPFNQTITAIALLAMTLPWPALGMSGTTYQVTDDSVLPGSFTQSSSNYTIDGSLEVITGEQSGAGYQIDAGSQLKEGTTASSDATTATAGGGGSGANQYIKPLPGPKPIVIGNGSVFTNSRFVTLYFDSGQTTQMNLVFNQENFPEGNWTSYANRIVFDLGKTDDLKKFLVKFRSEHNLVSSIYGAYVTLDTTAPNKPVVRYPSANAKINANQPVFYGQAEPNIRLSLKVGQRLYWLETGADGFWSFKIEPDLPLGSYILEVRAEDWAGNASEAVKVPFAITKKLIKIVPPKPVGEPLPPAGEEEEITEPTESVEVFIPMIPEELTKDYWYEKISYAVKANLAQKVLQQLRAGIRSISQGLARVNQQTGQKLIAVLPISEQLAKTIASPLEKLAKKIKVALNDVAGKIKKIVPAKKSLTELAQKPAIKPQEIPTLIPKELPLDMVMVKTRQGDLDLAWAGELKLTAGLRFYSFIRPSTKPKRIVGRLFFKQELGNWRIIKPAEAMSEVQAMEWQVAEVEYRDLKKNGIYMAEVQTPEVSGQYVFQTEIELADGSSKLFNLQATVEPNGYAYEKMERGIEGRLPKAEIALYSFNPQTKQFEIWPAKTYDQLNPQTTANSGEYLFLVPPGKYYLTARKNGYQDYQSKIMELKQTGPITQKIEMKYSAKPNWWQKLMFWK